MNDDLISRQAAIEALEKFEKQCWEDMCFKPLMSDARVIIKDLPAVQPEQKTGRWIYTNTIGGMRYYGCAICANQEKDCIADEHEIQWYNYCPNCGAKMETEE